MIGDNPSEHTYEFFKFFDFLYFLASLCPFEKNCSILATKDIHPTSIFTYVHRLIVTSKYLVSEDKST